MTNSRSGLLVFLLGAATVMQAQPLSAAPAQEPASSMPHEHAQAKPSTSLTVHAGDRTVTLSLRELQAMPQTTVSVFNAHNKQNETYSGPLVSDVLAKIDIALSEHTQHHILDSYVVATGTDGYFVVYSGAELQPGLHKTTVIVAIAQSGQPLTRTGAFQLIDPADVKPARWVRNLDSLTVMPVATAGH